MTGMWPAKYGWNPIVQVSRSSALELIRQSFPNGKDGGIDIEERMKVPVDGSYTIVYGVNGISAQDVMVAVATVGSEWWLVTKDEVNLTLHEVYWLGELQSVWKG